MGREGVWEWEVRVRGNGKRRCVGMGREGVWEWEERVCGNGPGEESVEQERRCWNGWERHIFVCCKSQCTAISIRLY